MLKAAIIYIPGSGGSFLRRVFSMSKNSIVDTPTNSVDLEEKFELCNYWHAERWKMGENIVRPEFHSGSYEFYHYEHSDLDLVDAWHPTEFLSHEFTEQCWIKGAWQHLIFVNIGDARREFIERNQKTKSYQVNWAQEQEAMLELKQHYRNRSAELDFDDIVDSTRFENAVTRIDSKLALGLDLDLAIKLWSAWYNTSREVWTL